MYHHTRKVSAHSKTQLTQPVVVEMANFEQMLEKFGYTTKDHSHKPRKRPWHIKQLNIDDESSSSEDND